MTTAERDLILEHTFAGNDLTDRIKLAELKGKHILARYTLEDLDELPVISPLNPITLKIGIYRGNWTGFLKN